MVTALPELLRQGGLDMLGTLHQRMGGDLQRMGLVDEDHDDRAWGRIFGSRIRQQQDNVTAPEAKGNAWGFQGGIDLYQSVEESGEEQHNAGIYGAYLRANADITAMTGATLQPALVGELRPEITALGAYWTYQREPIGFYLDAIVQRSWYDGEAEAVTGVRADIDGTGLLGSIEIGYGFDVSDNWMLEPQAQLIRQSSDIEDMAIPNAVVSYDSASSTVGRLGARLVGDYVDDDGSQFKPYLRANWWHGFDRSQNTVFRSEAAATPIATRIGYDSGEVGLGFSRSLDNQFSVYGELDYMFSLDDENGAEIKGASASLGFRYYW